jgi:hypothetical protein
LQATHRGNQLTRLIEREKYGVTPISLTCLAHRSYTADVLVMNTIQGAVTALLSATLLSASLGCGSKLIQFPEDHERFLRIDKTVESLRQSYEKKELSTMASLMVPTEQLERLQRDAAQDFEAYDKLALQFTIERIMIENDDIDVYVHWQGLWRKTPDDPGFRQRGHTRLQLVGTTAILLKAVQGDAPFGMKGRQAGPDSTPRQKK